MLSLISIKSLLQFQAKDIVFYVLGMFSFILGVFLSTKPVFVHPSMRIKIMGDDAHDSAAKVAFFMFTFFISLPFQIRIITYLATAIEPNNFSSYFFIIILIPIMSILISILIKIRDGLVNIFRIFKRRHSLRPIYCQVCDKPLRNINNLLNSFLNDKEITAKRIKSVYFEAWHCKNCCREPDHNSFHLRKYINLSDNFKICPNCQELTMVKITRIIKEATTTEEGKKSTIYSCNCCPKREIKLEIIPIIDTSGDSVGTD